MSVSLLGDGIFLVAVAWEAYGLSNRPSSLAYVGSGALAPPGGDAAGRRRGLRPAGVAGRS